MAFNNATAFVILLLAAFGLAAMLWVSISKSLQGLLQQAVNLPDATVFYTRSFLICLLLAAAAGTAGTAFDLKGDAKLMEFVWKIASGLESVFLYLLWLLVGYLVLITVLVAVLRSRREQ